MIERSLLARGLVTAALAVALLLTMVRADAPASQLSTPGPGAGDPGASQVSSRASATVSPVGASGSASPTPSHAVSAPPSTGATSPGQPSPVGTSTPAATVSPTATPPTALPTPVAGDSQPRLPVRAAFYYPWFPEAWKQQGMNPFTHYEPSIGYYDGSSAATIKAQIAAMQYARIEVGIASWWGRGSRTDARLPALLSAAARTTFRWSVYYEGEAQGDPSASQIHGDLAYLSAHYGSAPGFFRVNGRFVVFVYADGADRCGMVDRWTAANVGIGAYIVLKVFPGFRSCSNQPDGWHQYSPAVPDDSQAGYSYVISPGFWKANEAAARLPRDLARWSQSVRSMVGSGAPFQLVTTFNEWGEGTSVESATDWASSSGFGQYLDILHANGSG